MNLDDIVTKIDSPELAAYFAQYGKDTYISADDINTIVAVLKTLRDYLRDNPIPESSTPSLDEVLRKNRVSSLTPQFPAGIDPLDGTNLAQVQALISAFPSVDTNLFNTILTLAANIAHNLNAKKLKFTNGDFEVPALTLTETPENSKPNKVGTADGLVVKWTNKLGIQRVFAFMSDVLDKTTLVAQTVLSKVTFSGTLVHNPAVVSDIKSALVLNTDNEIKQALAVELMVDDGSLGKYNNPSELDAIFPTAVSGFELICENISTVNFPNGCIYKKTSGGWRVEKLYLISDV